MTAPIDERCGHAFAIQITRRQQDILRRITAGMSNKEIARDLDLALGTVKVHVAGLFRGLGVKNRTAAAAAGMRSTTEQRGAFAASPTLFSKNYAIRYSADISQCGLAAAS